MVNLELHDTQAIPWRGACELMKVGQGKGSNVATAVYPKHLWNRYLECVAWDAPPPEEENCSVLEICALGGLRT